MPKRFDQPLRNRTVIPIGDGNVDPRRTCAHAAKDQREDAEESGRQETIISVAKGNIITMQAPWPSRWCKRFPYN